MNTIANFFRGIADWFLDQLQTLALWIFDQFLSVVDVAISALPAPLLSSLPSIMSLGNDTLMLFGAINGWAALGMVGSAMIARIGVGFFLK